MTVEKRELEAHIRTLKLFIEELNEKAARANKRARDLEVRVAVERESAAKHASRAQQYRRQLEEAERMLAIHTST